MRAKYINENYPVGAKEDPRAPFNQPDGPDDVEVSVNNYGEIELNYIDRGEIENIDPYDFDHYIADREKISYEEIEDNEGVQILGIEYLKNDNYIFQTNFGKLQISLDELQTLL